MSICYLVSGEGEPKADSDAEDIGLFDITDMPQMAFDHNMIIDNARDDIDAILSKM